MKTYQKTITVREGEWFVFDPDYDWYQYNIYPNNPETVERKIKMFTEIEKLFREGKRIRISYDSMMGGNLLNIGMWDGWPFWKPTPYVLLKHWSGSEKHTWYDIQSYKVLEDTGE